MSQSYQDKNHCNKTGNNMGALDGVIQLILFVCFGVYVVMGMTLTVMGIIYMSDVGAVGATGSYLVFFGLCMLIVGVI